MPIDDKKLEEIWKISKRDDFFDLVVPSTIRELIGEIRRLKQNQQPVACRKAYDIWWLEQATSQEEPPSRLESFEAGWNARPERKIVAPPPGMGMRMEDVRVGMRMKSLYGGPEITVDELTDKGFKYSHPPYHLGARIGQTTGGEHYGYKGYSHYTEVESQS